ncbi:hypothetical protein BDV3_006002 [Batrachochytrium dendrobatidis]
MHVHSNTPLTTPQSPPSSPVHRSQHHLVSMQFNGVPFRSTSLATGASPCALASGYASADTTNAVKETPATDGFVNKSLVTVDAENIYHAVIPSLISDSPISTVSNNSNTSSGLSAHRIQTDTFANTSEQSTISSKASIRSLGRWNLFSHNKHPKPSITTPQSSASKGFMNISNPSNAPISIPLAKDTMGISKQYTSTTHPSTSPEYHTLYSAKPSAAGIVQHTDYSATDFPQSHYKQTIPVQASSSTPNHYGFSEVLACDGNQPYHTAALQPNIQTSVSTSHTILSPFTVAASMTSASSMQSTRTTSAADSSRLKYLETTPMGVYNNIPFSDQHESVPHSLLVKPTQQPTSDPPIVLVQPQQRSPFSKLFKSKASSVTNAISGPTQYINSQQQSATHEPCALYPLMTALDLDPEECQESMSSISVNESTTSSPASKTLSRNTIARTRSRSSKAVDASPLPTPELPESPDRVASPVCLVPFIDIRPILSIPSLSIPRGSPMAMRWTKLQPFVVSPTPACSLTYSDASSTLTQGLHQPSPSVSTKSTHPLPTRSHTATLINDVMFVFGGCNDTECRDTIMSFDPSTMEWQVRSTFGKKPLARRAHSAASYKDFLIIFGGGDGPTYFDDVAILDTRTFQWIHPLIIGSTQGKGLHNEPVRPRTRRAHVSWVYNDCFYVYGGGDGARALTDVWRLSGLANLDVYSKEPILEWTIIPTIPAAVSNTVPTPNSSTSGKNESNTASKGVPTARGYHTATLFNRQLVIYGGSDARECFSDVWSLHMDTMHWTRHITRGSSMTVGGGNSSMSVARLAHSAIAVGPFLVVVGGHDGVKYSKDIRVLDVRSMFWMDDTVVQRKWIQHASRSVQSVSKATRNANPVGSSNPTEMEIKSQSKPFEKLNTTAVHGSSLNETESTSATPKSVVSATFPGAAPSAESPTQADSSLVVNAKTEGIPATQSLPLASKPAPATELLSKKPPLESSVMPATHHNSVPAASNSEPRKQRVAPSGRGYHSAVLMDHRIVLYGGFNGIQVFNDLWVLDLGFRSYLLNQEMDKNDSVGSIAI